MVCFDCLKKFNVICYWENVGYIDPLCLKCSASLHGGMDSSYNLGILVNQAKSYNYRNDLRALDYSIIVECLHKEHSLYTSWWML